MNREQFYEKYSIKETDNINCYLAKWNNVARSKRPVISDELKSTVCQSGKTAQIWIQSDACRYSKVGACTCCDYFQGQTNVEQFEAFLSALSQIAPDSNTIVLNTCGSVMDENELKMDVLVQILERIQETNVKTVVLETHISTITEYALNALTRFNNVLDIYFEIGIETLNNDINRLILNKLPFKRNISQVIELVHSYGFKITGNVMTGFPFLSRVSQISDSVKTIKSILALGVDFVVLFPINIKNYTFMYELYKNGFYKEVDGRILVDILSYFSPDELEYINVGWYGEPRISIPGYRSDDMIVPFYCQKCYKQMMQLWLDYNCSTKGIDRSNIILKMKNIVCDCNKVSITRLYDTEINYSSLDSAYRFFLDKTNTKVKV